MRLDGSTVPRWISEVVMGRDAAARARLPSAAIASVWQCSLLAAGSDC